VLDAEHRRFRNRSNAYGTAAVEVEYAADPMSEHRIGQHVSPQWARWRASVDLDEYSTRWDRLAGRGHGVHGEVDFVMSFGAGSVLDAGCGMGRIAIELHRRGVTVDGVDLDDDLLAYARRAAPYLRWFCDDLATMQLDRQYELVAMPGNVMVFCRREDRRAVVHTAVQHLLPGGLLVTGFQRQQAPEGLDLDEFDELCADCELTLVERWATWERDPFDGGSYVVSVHRRTERFTVHDMLFEARRSISRVTAAQLHSALSGPQRPTVVDTRTHTDRARFGVIDGSVHVPRTVLEWNLDPASGYRNPLVASYHQPLVVVCNGGYSSSLAAASLVRLGFTDVSDLVGGIHAWSRAGLPLTSPDHSFVDVLHGVVITH
jgi:rhodanese-related sulfurtransferase